MTKSIDRGPRGWIARVALGAALFVALPARAQTQPPSAYDQLPTDQLIKRLSLLGMTELLDALEQEIPAKDSSMAGFATRGRIRVGLANSLVDPAQRNKLLDEAIPFLRQAVKIGEKSTKLSPDETLAWYRYTLELAVTMGRYRIENPHVLRLRHLQGGQADRQIVLKYTKEAVDLVDVLKDDIADTLTDWRPDMKLLMIYVPKLEDLQRETKYNAAWIRLHRAMALDAGGERTQLCRDMVAEMREFTTDRESGVMYWALYVTGIAHRLLKTHKRADVVLGQAAVPEAESKDLRQRAWFERARNRIEEGSQTKTDQAIKDFERGSMAIWGPERQVVVDLRVVLLRNYMYELLVAKEKTPTGIKKMRDKAQEVLLSFVEKYADRPKLVKAFLDIIATKFAGVEDLEGAGAIVLLARAYSKVESEDAKDQAEAEKLLRKVLVHPDMKSERIAKSIEPGVLWELAFLMNKTKRNSAAAAYFVVLARRYPEHRLAPRSAKFAVQSLYAVFQERRAKGKAIEVNLRLEFIRGIDTLFSKWPKEEGVAKWNFDLASNCMQLAAANQSTAVKFHWQSRAIAAFENVPPELVEYMEARHSALSLRSQVMLKRDDLAGNLKPDNERAMGDLKDLARQLAAYDEIVLPGAAPAAGPTTAPSDSDANEPAPAGTVGERAEELRKQLTERLQVYSDPQALTDLLSKYSTEAGKESRKVAQQAQNAAGKEKQELEDLAAQLKDWGAEADFHAAEIKYDRVARGKKADERVKLEQEALEDLRGLTKKWPGTAVLQRAYEFEIRKLVARGQTGEAIQKIQDFKKDYAEQAKQLIELVVQQIQAQIQDLRKRLREARTASEAESIKEELRSYQLAYASFAEDLYKPIKDAPISLDALDLKVRQIEALEKKGDFDAILAEAEKFAELVAKFGVPAEEIAGAKALAEQIAEAKRPGVDKKTLLPNLAGALINALNDLRDVVQERYYRFQMFGDSLVQKGRAEAMRNETLEAKAAFQKSLELFLKTTQVDEARRKVEADELEATYRPRIAAVKSRAKSMEMVRRMIDELRKEFVAVGKDPNESPDIGTLEYSFDFLRKAPNPKEEKKRLPRTVNLLVRGWENLLRDLKFHLKVDHKNVIGRARVHRGLKQYGEAMRFYCQYTDGLVETSEFYWPAQLERCQCHLEGYRSNPEAMKNLVIHINMLALKDKTMGGLAPDFEDIKRQAEKEAAKAKKKARRHTGGG